MTSSDSLTVFLSAPDDADESYLAAVEALEDTFDEELQYTLADNGSLVRLPQRDQWVTERVRGGSLPLVCNGREDTYLELAGDVIDPAIGPGEHGVVEVSAKVPCRPPVVGRARDALAALAVAMDAYWGSVNPSDVGAIVGQQVVHEHVPTEPPLGLPALTPRHELSDPAIPRHAGWINYWSEKTCDRLDDLEDRLRTGRWYRFRYAENGSVTVQLTQEPLSLDEMSHLEALRKFYQAFPEIGERDRE